MKVYNRLEKLNVPLLFGATLHDKLSHYISGLYKAFLVDSFWQDGSAERLVKTLEGMRETLCQTERQFTAQLRKLGFEIEEGKDESLESVIQTLGAETPTKINGASYTPLDTTKITH